MADIEIKLRAGQERLESLNSGVFRRSQSGQDYDAMCKMLAHFMVGADGRYLGDDAALNLLDSLSMKEISDTAEKMAQIVEDSAAPKVSETQSIAVNI